MWKYLPVIIAGFLCVSAIVVSRYPFVKSGVVSHETMLIEQYRSEVIKEHVGEDLVIRRSPPQSGVSQREKLINNRRTLRVYTASDGHAENASFTLFIDQVKPEQTFHITGKFRIAEKYPDMRWVGGNKIVFDAINIDGTKRTYVLDVFAPSISLLSGM
jgi:hypothetical protein